MWRQSDYNWYRISRDEDNHSHFGLCFDGYWHGPSNPYLGMTTLSRKLACELEIARQPEPTPGQDLQELRATIAAEPLTPFNQELLTTIDREIERPIYATAFNEYYWHGPSNLYINELPPPALRHINNISSVNNQYRIMARCTKIKRELMEYYARKTMDPRHLRPLLADSDKEVDEFMMSYVDGL